MTSAHVIELVASVHVRVGTTCLAEKWGMVPIRKTDFLEE